MIRIFISLALALLGFNAAAQNFSGLAGQVFTGVGNNLIIGAGDSAECGTQSAINNAIGRVLSRGNYYPSNNLDQCLNQKRWERERLQQQALMERQQALYRQQAMEDEMRRRQQQLEDDARRFAQQRAEEERRMAPKCRFQIRETAKGGVAAPKEESKECSGERYENFIQQMTLK